MNPDHLPALSHASGLPREAIAASRKSPGGRVSGERVSFRFVAAAIACAFLVLFFGQAFLIAQALIPTYGGPPVTMVDIDRAHYVLAAERFLHTGTPYLAAEVAAPFTYGHDTFLHPPIALILFVPFIWLPPWLYYAVPLLGLILIVGSWKPPIWAWPFLGLCLAWPVTARVVVLGNSDLWAGLLVAAGLRFGWPAALLVIKPTFLPFAILGGKRGLYAFVLVALLALPFGTLWIDWLHLMQNSPASLGYSVASYPLALLPVIAMATSTHFREQLAGHAILRIVDVKVRRLVHSLAADD